jgi:sugar phosphate isomerase/epimerase
MNIGMNIYDGIPLTRQVEYFKKYGVTSTFLGGEIPEFDQAMVLLQENGILCESLHAPYNGINAMWGEDEEAGQKMLDRLKDSVDKCAKYGIPVVVVHLSSGRPMTPISKIGLQRYEALFSYAQAKGVTVALENQRYLENLSFFMEHYDTPAFCWDNGHQYCCLNGVDLMGMFGHRLAFLHIHDNRNQLDTDDHLIPFDGNIPFDEVARQIAESGFEGTLMLELGKLTTIDGKPVYGDMNDEEYIQRAATAARQVAEMVEVWRARMR